MPTDPGERLARLRWLLGLSQGELSAMTGISQSHLSLMEHGQRNLTPEVAARIARATHTPVTFFFQELPPIPAALSFRKLASAAALHTVTARFEEIERLVLELDDRVPFPQVDLPRVESHPVTAEAIEDLAQSTRKAFGIGATGPILNLTRSLERKGLIVAPIAGGTRNCSRSTTACPGRIRPVRGRWLPTCAAARAIESASLRHTR